MRGAGVARAEGRGEARLLRSEGEVEQEREDAMEARSEDAAFDQLNKDSMRMMMMPCPPRLGKVKWFRMSPGFVLRRQHARPPRIPQRPRREDCTIIVR